MNLSSLADILIVLYTSSSVVALKKGEVEILVFHPTVLLQVCGCRELGDQRRSKDLLSSCIRLCLCHAHNLPAVLNGLSLVARLGARLKVMSSDIAGKRSCKPWPQ